MPRRSRPPIPTALFRGGKSAAGWVGVEPSIGLGIGGALCSNHFLCKRAPFSRSKNIFSPPARKENLMHSGPSSFCGAPLRMGAGDSDRCIGVELYSLRFSVAFTREAPHISQLNREG
ncbi:hypothetical protein MPH_12734 [Macrophomina phaseolina MS6]|uniref:Uncharacterized protein n=1 Tax=Macrophomina phaseolina (strain MS6) TaxID=1126212 RepID=K2RJ54_MACPH|nr:hypothetical protein MPH_12734 [Macrophomina phaseolina MS6]